MEDFAGKLAIWDNEINFLIAYMHMWHKGSHRKQLEISYSY